MVPAAFIETSASSPLLERQFWSASVYRYFEKNTARAPFVTSFFLYEYTQLRRSTLAQRKSISPLLIILSLHIPAVDVRAKPANLKSYAKKMKMCDANALHVPTDPRRKMRELPTYAPTDPRRKMKELPTYAKTDYLTSRNSYMDATKVALQLHMRPGTCRADPSTIERRRYVSICK